MGKQWTQRCGCGEGTTAAPIAAAARKDNAGNAVGRQMQVQTQMQMDVYRQRDSNKARAES